MAGTHQDLRGWRESIHFTVEVYRETRGLPDSEKFGLTSQLRRASVSIPSNLSEGAARDSTVEYVRCITIAIASASEVDTQLEISRRLGFLSNDSALRLLTRVNQITRMLLSLRTSIRNRIDEAK